MNPPPGGNRVEEVVRRWMRRNLVEETGILRVVVACIYYTLKSRMRLAQTRIKLHTCCAWCVH